jgi:hypothetical protein
LRCYKAEPFYVLQLVNGLVVGLLLIFVMPRTSLLVLAGFYLIIATIPVLLISGVIFRNYRKEAQSDRLQPPNTLSQGHNTLD